MENPMQMLNNIKAFFNNYNGKDPKSEAMQKIQASGMSQADLNKLQQDANTIYNLCQQMGLIK